VKAHEKRRMAREAWRSVPRILPYLKPRRGAAGLSAGATLLAALVGLLQPWPLALVVDGVLGDRPVPSFLTALVGENPIALLVLAVTAGLGVTVVGHGLTVLNEYLQTRIDLGMVLDLRSDLFRHVQRLSMTFHNDKRTGDLVMRINAQAAKVGQITMAVPPLAQSILTLFGMFVIAYRIDRQLALLSLSVVPFIYYSIGYYARNITPHVLHVRALEGRSLSIVYEAISMLRVIVAFGREFHEYHRFRGQAKTAVEARVRLTVRQTLFSLVVDFITGVGTALVLGFGAYFVLQGRLSVGQLLVVLSYIAAVYGPLQRISGTLAALQEDVVILHNSFQLLDLEPDVKDGPGAVPVSRADGEVAFQGVRFAYPRGNEVLEDISFEAEAGQFVAIVGPTGAGKTTLVSLIPRFYDPQRGRILLDGTDVRNLTLESLRSQISIVLQEPLLFSGTIADNIRYGRLEASMEEVASAAQAANAHDFIMRLPRQYETELGERGANLSGGERQRICVARAFLKDAPILILDEPTSSIDSRTETTILDALERLARGRTTFMIAHRLSTIRRADQVLVLSEGRIVERGMLEELLERGGLFRQLYEGQTARQPARVELDGEGAVAPIKWEPARARGEAR
jgi:ATP-binding cassette subfamily B protein